MDTGRARAGRAAVPGAAGSSAYLLVDHTDEERLCYYRLLDELL
ncbi:hypothetical protein [Nonomuraea jiangxiensis]|nr:hypothetical protein [Nonomuraea jiangxiensis]